jgi:plastocyanin
MNTIKFLVRGATLLRPLLLATTVLTFLLAGSAPPAAAATNLVKMVSFTFQPALLTNNVGDTVLWTNTTSFFHNVVSSNNAWTAPATFPSPGTFLVTFTNAGTYGYFCSPHHLSGMTGIVFVQAPNQLPVVALTNPPTGITRAEPATITLGASASDPDGSVTNVQFFSGTTALGSDTSSPYSFTVSNLAAGTYDFTAKATDNLGLSKTSAVVTVFVVTPGTIVFDNNLTLVGGNLPLRVTVTPGLSYAIDYTTTFTNWVPFTNFVATNSVMSFASPTTENDRRFFRARLLPNP